MLKLNLGYAPDSQRGLRYAHAAQRVLRAQGVAADAFPATAEDLLGEEIDAWVTDASERWQVEGALLAAVGERQPTGAVVLSTGPVPGARMPAMIWAHEWAWQVQWAEQHPAHVVSLVAAPLAMLFAGLHAGEADAVLVAKDLVPLSEPAPEAEILPPIGRGLPLWWARATDVSLPDWMAQLHHPPSALLAQAERHLLSVAQLQSERWLGRARWQAGQMHLEILSFGVKGRAFAELVVAQPGQLSAALDRLTGELLHRS